jgi:hypothetical protein
VKFLDADLDLRYVDGCAQGHQVYELLQPFSYAVGAPDGTTVIHVPIGFLTDFASIPKPLQGILSPTGWYGKAAVLHDDLYQSGRIGELIIDQRYADDVLLEAMRVLAADALVRYGVTHHGVRHNPLRDWLDSELIYRGVRLGGFVAWRACRRAGALRDGPP